VVAGSYLDLDVVPVLRDGVGLGRGGAAKGGGGGDSGSVNVHRGILDRRAESPKTLTATRRRRHNTRLGGSGDRNRGEHTRGEQATTVQGLSLVHFSAQLEPCLTRKNTLHAVNTP